MAKPRKSSVAECRCRCRDGDWAKEVGLPAPDSGCSHGFRAAATALAFWLTQWRRRGRAGRDLEHHLRAAAERIDPMRKIRFLSMLAAVTAVALAMVVAASPAARAETWGLSDDTALAGGHDVVGNPTEYLSTLPGQLEAIRIVYRIASGHVEEMAVNGISWSVRDLTALTHAPAAAGDPAASQTRLSGQDPVGQVVYRTAGGHIELLTIRGNPLPAATGVDLTALTGAPVAAGDPAMYQTNLAGQGLVLRIVYRAAGWGGAHIVELSVRAGHPWKQADLTALTGAPAAAGNPAGYETHLDGQGSTGRVVYRTAGGHVEELSVRAG